MSGVAPTAIRKQSNKCRRCGINRYTDDGHREARAWCPATHTFGDRTNDAGRGQGEKLAVLSRGWSFPGPIVVQPDPVTGHDSVVVVDDPTWTSTEDVDVIRRELEQASAFLNAIIVKHDRRVVRDFLDDRRVRMHDDIKRDRRPELILMPVFRRGRGAHSLLHEAVYQCDPSILPYDDALFNESNPRYNEAWTLTKNTDPGVWVFSSLVEHARKLRIDVDRLRSPVDFYSTALHAACFIGSRACVEILTLRAGARFDIRTEAGWLPIHYACHRDASPTAKQLVPWLIESMRSALWMEHDALMALIAPPPGFVEGEHEYQLLTRSPEADGIAAAGMSVPLDHCLLHELCVPEGVSGAAGGEGDSDDTTLFAASMNAA